VSDELERTSVELTSVYLRMSGLLFSEENLQSSLDLMCQLAKETIPGTSGAGVTLVQGDGEETFTAAHSDELVKEADEIQYELDEGPCLSALREGKTYRVDSSADDTRWPKWAPAAAALGISSVLSVPLMVRGKCIGAVKIYSQHPNEYDENDERILGMFAGQAAIVLSNVLEYSSAHEMTSRLKAAFESRDLVERAKGIIMARNGIDEEEAFESMMRSSVRDNAKLVDIARELVDQATSRGGD
jgi:GAF domain-containing protein